MLHTFDLNGETIPYALLRHPLRKRLTLRVTPSGTIEARAPERMRQTTVEKFIRQQADWLLATRQTTLTRSPTMHDGALLPLLDEQLTLRVLPDGLSRIRRNHQELLAPTPLVPGGLEAALERWYRLQARGHLTDRLHHWSRLMQTPALKLTIRGQASRWGSCSSRGAISLNWQLMLLPARVVDYVIVHELCHLLEMNHSPAFWSHVANVLPEYASLRGELKAFRMPFRADGTP
ncbi:MAG: M48 family metallopeptidase [Magnetococcales bacterium]|nr:M48 family metallopeptidase [Magnetococcales bacterium]